MLNEQDLRGIFIPVITPFTPSGELDLDSYRTYAGHLVKQRIQGLVVNGTTGESPTVTWEEAAALLQATKELAKGQHIPVIMGTGTNDTAATVRRTEQAGLLGADAALVVVPYYSRPSQAGIIEHFRQAARVGIPVIAYEIPYRTGVKVTVDTMREILEIDGVIGLKDSSGGTELVSELTRFDSKPVLCGEDAYFYTSLASGASGGMLASANVRTNDFAEVYRLAQSGRFLDAKRAFDTLLPLIRLLFREPNPCPVKWLLSRQGLIASSAVRLPLCPITSSLEHELAAYV
ncbi:4-hydroxy-tetrahydrodipicolinate synthase [Paenibacillus thalictri]|uniref:4-hydroxy-tetrahydrodipicolinate synthase n=1 Tax=Paenibacillus thalictri TaxID=2527873 RepID=A0A4Q9DZD2_9BACL|nr:4-hydroxy-tetrahydrodipicolinate synthase [Paenibacillus thalictri]TBL81796.1 4-hydroxy-tetrahydrodipicolinate synthase [Paenibacillus thalictri]